MAVVLDGHVVPAVLEPRIVGHEPDDPQRGMRGRIEQLLLERNEAPPQDVGLGRLELCSQPVETRAVVASEEHLHRCRFGNSTSTAIMTLIHDS